MSKYWKVVTFGRTVGGKRYGWGRIKYTINNEIWVIKFTLFQVTYIYIYCYFLQSASILDDFIAIIVIEFVLCNGCCAKLISILYH